ncbi:HAD-IA family hydrolase [Pedobacter aquatilis]|uniref:HAD family hydrolase n=1 Tax=Pedobacter aquatilis TaxID=351343 RepID=UPI0025B46E18|nr:HAD-IA family hydrolase [Pedobacter aquatilis]MDN3585389.1 HAD-IA family hydrolase [Pedobacter aquatilis]
MIASNLNKLKLVIFDVDGTLYDQIKLRRKMMFSLLAYYLFRPWKLKELLIIYHFRKEREKKADYQGSDLQNEQYYWCGEKVDLSFEKIKSVVDKWIFDFPNRHLNRCIYPGVENLFTGLKKKKIAIAIYSDYDSELKMRSMDLNPDLIVSSTDHAINSMKPQPKGLNSIIEKFKIIDKSECLYIGDRDELDGECARRIGIPYIIINKSEAYNNFYITLSKQILNED